MCDFNVVSALTFSFSGITLIVLLRNFAFSKPTIKVYDHGGDSTRPYQSLIIEIAKPDDAKFSLHRISICSPKETLISKVPNEGSEPYGVALSKCNMAEHLKNFGSKMLVAALSKHRLSSLLIQTRDLKDDAPQTTRWPTEP